MKGMAASDEPVHTLNVTFDQLLAVGGVYSNYVHIWFTQHEITLDFLTQRGGDPAEGVAEATLVARIKVAPSAMGLMLGQIIEAYEMWIETAAKAGFQIFEAPETQPEDDTDE